MNIKKGENIMTENLPSLTPSQNEFSMYQTIAKNAVASGLYSVVGSESKIFMVLLAARELGISPMMALNGGIWNIQGKIEISARLMNALIRRAGHSLTVVESTNKICTLKGKRSDGDTFECSFTIEDAALAGLASRDVWKKYPSDMLYNRCMSRLCRRLFPDVIGTSYVEGEIRDAKEVEKLEVAQFEELPTQELPREIQKISNDQVEEINDLMEQLDTDSKAKMWNYLSRSGIQQGKTEDIPLSEYIPVLRGIKANLERLKSTNERLENAHSAA
jgi:hypothetical protein